MWTTLDPTRDVPDEETLNWFPSPDGTARRINKLDQWEKGKFHDGVPPPKISRKWLRVNGLLLLKDYEALILDDCRTQWRRGGLSLRERVWEDSKTAEFTFNDAFEDVKNASETLRYIHKHMHMALLYHMSSIINRNMKMRLIRLRETEENVTWTMAKDLVLGYMEGPGIRHDLEDLVCRRRAEGELLSDWIAQFETSKAALAKASINLPDTLR